MSGPADASAQPDPASDDFLTTDFADELMAVAGGHHGNQAWRVLRPKGRADEGIVCLETGPNTELREIACSPLILVEASDGRTATDSVFRVPPTLTQGEPVFVFGAVASRVTRVGIRAEGEASVTAQLVDDAIGANQRYFVALLPRGPSVDEAIAYGFAGSVLERSKVGAEDEVTTSCWKREIQSDKGPHHLGGCTASGKTSGTGSSGRPASPDR